VTGALGRVTGIEDGAGDLLAGEERGVDPLGRERGRHPRCVAGQVDVVGKVEAAERHLERSALERRPRRIHPKLGDPPLEIASQYPRANLSLRRYRADGRVVAVGKDPEVAAGESGIDLHPERLEPDARHVVFGGEAIARGW
jgi:hypothetical protein